MVEWARLESECARKGTKGSNPFLSAFFVRRLESVRRIKPPPLSTEKYSASSFIVQRYEKNSFTKVSEFWHVPPEGNQADRRRSGNPFLSAHSSSDGLSPSDE